MDNIQKLEFLKRVLTDTVGDEVVRNNFFEKNEICFIKKLNEENIYKFSIFAF